MNKALLLAFFFVVGCSAPQSKVYPENVFSRLSEDQKFPLSDEIKNSSNDVISVFSRLTLRRLIAKHVVNLSTIYDSDKNVRVDVFTPGIPKLLFLITRTENNVQLVVPEERTTYIGDANSTPLDRIMGFPLKEFFLLNLLLGKSKIPENYDLIEHSDLLIFRVKYKDSSGFLYRLYFKKFNCETDNELDSYKFSGMEVLSKENEYLFFAKLNFVEHPSTCAQLNPQSVEFENFNNRFSGVIDKIQIKDDLKIGMPELNKYFSPMFPGYLVKPLVRESFK